jgi:hypothetical protein
VLEPHATPSADQLVQQGVEVGTACAPAGALGATADGTTVRCVRDQGGALLWQVG